jgi:Xaa-Pro aminopeptidase
MILAHAIGMCNTLVLLAYFSPHSNPLRRCNARLMKITMFQTYASPPPGSDSLERVRRLRELMALRGLDAVLVPRSDEHQGEYVAPCAERLAWLTGFTGSAGLAVVGRTAAALFVDGRYVVQAPRQVDTRTFEMLGSAST